MSTSDDMGASGPRHRADVLAEKLALVRDALSLDVGDGIDTVDGARLVREERDRLAWRVRELEGAAQDVKCDHGHRVRSAGCVSCVLVFGALRETRRDAQ